MAGHSKSRKKRKHKHKNIDRTEEKSSSYHTALKPSKPPTDTYSFIKHEPHFMMPGAETVLHVGGGGGGVVGPTGVVGGGVGGGGVSAAQILQQQQVVYGTSAGISTSVTSVCVCVCVYH